MPAPKPRLPRAPHDHYDLQIAALATRQHGVVTWAQLRAIGLSSTAISARVGCGRLHRMLPGVYAVGHPVPSRLGWMVAALLSCGEPSAIARRTALEVWGVWRPTERPIDVVVMRRKRVVDGLRVHHTRVLEPWHVTNRRGVVVTTVARTLVDLALELDSLQLSNVIHELVHRRLFRAREFERCIARMHASVGTPVAIEALEHVRAGSAGTKSELERRVRALILELGLEMPVSNVSVHTRIGHIELDTSWPGITTYLEVDGPGHARKRTQNADRDRRIALRDKGWTEFRVGFLELDLDRPGVSARLLAVLPVAR